MYTHILFYISCEVIAHCWGGVGGEGMWGIVGKGVCSNK